jgi:O-antigen/teichoic acid export membrane protein
MHKLKTLLKSGDKNFLEIIRHAFWAVFLLMLTTIVQFIFDLLLTRRFGASGSGTFYLSFSIATALALIGRLGLEKAVIRFIPPLLKNSPSRAMGVQKTAVNLSIIITIPLSLMLLLLAESIAVTIFNSPVLSFYLKVFAVGLPFLSLNYIYSGVLRALKKTQSALSIERLIMYSLGIVSILTAGSLWSLNGVVVGFVISIIASNLVGLYMVKKNMPKPPEVILFDKKKMIVTAAPLLFVVFATQMTGQASLLILGSFTDSSSVGVFNIALKISMLMSIILTAINVIAATQFSELYYTNKKQELEKIIGKTSSLAALIGLCLFIFIALFPKTLLGFFGNEFIIGYSALIVLAAGQLVHVSVGSTNFVLAMTGQERKLAGAVGFSLIVNILTALILIPRYGILGASIATSLSLMSANIVMVFIVKKHLGIWQLPFKYILVWFKVFKNS